MSRAGYSVESVAGSVGSVGGYAGGSVGGSVEGSVVDSSGSKRTVGYGISFIGVWPKCAPPPPIG